MPKFTFKLASLVLVVTLLLNACKKDPTDPTVSPSKAASTYDAKVATTWMGISPLMIKSTAGYTPPVAARALGYIGTTFYESVVPGMADHKSLVNQLTSLNELPKIDANAEYYWPACANAAMASIHAKLFPTAPKARLDTLATIKNLLEADFKTAGVKDDVLLRSNEFGEKIAQAIFDWSAKDLIGHEGYKKNFPSTYTPPVGPAFWVPTDANKIPMQPYWGFVRSFVPGNVDNVQPNIAPKFSTDSTSLMFKSALEVYTTSKALTAEQKIVALYWADGGGTITPSGHSLMLARQMILDKDDKLDLAAETFAKVGIAVGDAFIACWKCKYQYSLLRPVSYIQKYIDPTWTSLIKTPPFPEHSSGHSTQSAATATVLTSMYGDNTPFVDKTNSARTDIDGTPRAFKSFTDLAREAAISRLYGGIHYMSGNEVGLMMGSNVGANVLKLKWK
ncbi:MAG: hypothetical protein RLZZ292_769 [Bacteroidota bacterium]|jgi:hypothetical protein